MNTGAAETTYTARDIAELNRHAHDLHHDLAAPDLPEPLRHRIQERLDQHRHVIAAHTADRQLPGTSLMIATARTDDERCLIAEAVQRLLARTPQRSNGKLTIAAPAVESGVSRQRLYEHHTDLVTAFQAQATGTPEGSLAITALTAQLADARERIRELETANTALEEKIRTLCAVITELAHETNATNVVAVPARKLPSR